MKDASDRIQRSKKFEVHLLLVRFFNILLQQNKKRKEESSSSGSTHASSSKRGQFLWFFTAKMLLEESDCMQFCYRVLLALLDIKESLMTKEVIQIFCNDYFYQCYLGACCSPWRTVEGSRSFHSRRFESVLPAAIC